MLWLRHCRVAYGRCVIHSMLSCILAVEVTTIIVSCFTPFGIAAILSHSTTALTTSAQYSDAGHDIPRSNSSFFKHRTSCSCTQA